MSKNISKTLIENQTMDTERALYESKNIEVSNCNFDGLADGESALKESSDVFVHDSFFNLRYPFWHNTRLIVKNCTLTPLSRAALWYSKDVEFCDCTMNGIKAVRECKNVSLKNCTVNSPEFGWNNADIKIQDCEITSEYFLMNSKNLTINNFSLNGKYSFQYVKNGIISNSFLNTKDAFWHAKNLLIQNCEINGEYIGWYSDKLTFINCTIRGTQPFCYCKNLKLINCKMIDCDLAFEKSNVKANLTEPVISIKNPYKGKIVVPDVQEIIITDKMAKGKILCQNKS